MLWTAMRSEADVYVTACKFLAFDILLGCGVHVVDIQLPDKWLSV